MNAPRSVVHGVVLWLLAACMIALGTYYSLNPFLDGNWLSRSGCAIVVLGIWSGVGAVIEERVLREALNLEKNLAIARLRFRLRKDTVEMEQSVQERQHAYDERQELMNAELRTSFGFLEASLLVTGTLIWGFGDLIKYLR